MLSCHLGVEMEVSPYRLARNVPFTLGGVTVLLQVHVMDAAPYTVLLEWPFDTITESRIVNDKKGN